MILKIVSFDEYNPNWVKSREYNILFLHCALDHINGIIKNRGYIYLNQIYETLGAKWNPDWDNPCVRHDEKLIVNFSSTVTFEERILVEISTIEQF